MLEDFAARRRELASVSAVPDWNEAQEWLRARPRPVEDRTRPALGLRADAKALLTSRPALLPLLGRCTFILLTGLWLGAERVDTAWSHAALGQKIEELRGVTKAGQVEWGLELTGPDPRLHAEIAAASGLLTWRGGPLETYLALGRSGDLPVLLTRWAYVEDLAQAYSAAGIPVRREVRGMRGTALVPPGLAVAVLLIEAGLARENGATLLSFGYTPCGHLLQDVAAMAALTRLAPQVLPAGITCLIWPGGALAGPGGAAAVAGWTSLTAAFGGAERAEIGALEEGPEQAAALLAAAYRTARLARDQRLALAEAARVEEELIVAEAQAVLRRVLELGEGDLKAGTAAALADGSLDVPLAASGVCRGEALAARDLSGAVRFLDPGRLPLPPEVKEFHRRRLAQRARAEGREPGVSMVIDDIYALNKGALVGHLS